MNTEQAVQSSIGLLRRISENPKGIVDDLDPAERDRLMTGLSVLAERSARVEDETDLLYVTDALHHLLEETPALAGQPSPRDDEVKSAQERPTTRKITFEYDREVYQRSSYAHQHAVQIRNHVVECREKLRQALPRHP